MTTSSIFGEMLQTIAERGRMLMPFGRRPQPADRIDDLSGLLRRLSEDPQSCAPSPQADEPVHPPLIHAHPRAGDALVRLLRQDPALADELLRPEAHAVMPKGRNFH